MNVMTTMIEAQSTLGSVLTGIRYMLKRKVMVRTVMPWHSHWGNTQCKS